MRRLTILSILVLSYMFSRAQCVLLDEQWRPKINRAISLVQKTDPMIFETIKKAYIQAGEIRCKQMNAFSQLEYRYNKEIPWIMLDREALDEFDYKMIASILLHEAWHLLLWDHGNGKNWGDMTNQEQNEEHRFIYTNQIAFLKKVNADDSYIYHYKCIMSQLGIN